MRNKTYGLPQFTYKRLDFIKAFGGKPYKKVYCRNCRFFNKSFVRYRLNDWLECRLEAVVVDTWEKKKKIYPVSPEDKNARNNCKDCKKRWWRKN